MRQCEMLSVGMDCPGWLLRLWVQRSPGSQRSWREVLTDTPRPQKRECQSDVALESGAPLGTADRSRGKALAHLFEGPWEEPPQSRHWTF